MATVLKENPAMVHVFLKRYPNAKTIAIGSEIKIVMNFDQTAQQNEDGDQKEEEKLTQSQQ